MPVDGTSPTDRALAYLDAFRDLYGLSSPREQLHVVREAGEGDERDIFFGQSVRGVPVHDAQLAVHLRGDSVIATNGAYLPLLPAATKPWSSAEEATAVAQTAAGRSDDAVEPAELTYFNASLTMNEAERAAWDLEAATHLAWRVSLPTRRVARRRAHGSGADRPRPGRPRRHRSLDQHGVERRQRAVLQLARRDRVVRRERRPARRHAIPTPKGGTRSTFANDTYDYFRSRFGRRSFDDRGHADPDDARRQRRGVHPGQLERRLQPPLSRHLLHEQHGRQGRRRARVHARRRPLHGQPQLGTASQGSLNEHYSDFFAAMIDPDWRIAEGSATRNAART